MEIGNGLKTGVKKVAFVNTLPCKLPMQFLTNRGIFLESEIGFPNMELIQEQNLHCPQLRYETLKLQIVLKSDHDLL